MILPNYNPRLFKYQRIFQMTEVNKSISNLFPAGRASATAFKQNEWGFLSIHDTQIVPCVLFDRIK